MVPHAPKGTMGTRESGKERGERNDGEQRREISMAKMMNGIYKFRFDVILRVNIMSAWNVQLCP